MGQITEGQDWSGEFEDYHKDGSHIWIDAGVARICNASGRPIGIVDTSTTSRRESGLRRSGIRSSMSSATRADLREPLKEIRKAGERSASLTRQLLAFSLHQVLAPKILDINEAVYDMKNDVWTGAGC